MFSRKLILILSFFILSCSENSSSKEEYLRNYNNLLNEVSLQAEKLNTDDEWKPYDERYKYFSHNMKIKFSDKLTTEDRLTLIKFKTKYNALRYKKVVKENLVKAADFFVETPNKVNDYIENDLKEDAEIIVRNTKALGNEVKETFNKTIDEIRDRHN